MVFCVGWLSDCVPLLDKYCNKLGNHFLLEQCESSYVFRHEISFCYVFPCFFVTEREGK